MKTKAEKKTHTIEHGPKNIYSQIMREDRVALLQNTSPRVNAIDEMYLCPQDLKN